ncbi:hypothetical protein SCALM49S_06692 [Streptomyces californicus]
MALQFEEQRGVVDPSAAAPRGDGQREARDQHVPGACAHGGGGRGEQRFGDVGRQGERHRPGLGPHIDRRVQGPVAEERVGCFQHRPPEGQFTGAPARLLAEEGAPPPQRGPDRFEGLSLPGRPEVAEEGLPGNGVHSQMMHEQQQPSGLRPGVEPHRAHQVAPVGDQFRLGGPAVLLDRLAQRVGVGAGGVHSAGGRRGGARRGDGEPPLLVQGQPECVMPVEDRLERGGQTLGAEPARHDEQHRLVVAVDGTAEVAQFRHDRGGSSGPVAMSWATGAVWSATRAAAAMRATVLCSKTSRGVMRSPALRARLTSLMETMLSPPRSKKPWPGSTSGRPSTSAKRA